MKKQLLILGCADRKRNSKDLLPALDMYDGPAYRVIRKFLREYQWPEQVSIAVLSAKYGLFGIFRGIEHYDRRMDVSTAAAKAAECSSVLTTWAESHQSIHLSLGKDYMPAVEPALGSVGISKEIFHGGIGRKLSQIKAFMSSMSPPRRIRPELGGGTGSFSYFLPDWDDLLDPAFDFEADSFSGPSRSARGDQHCCVLMRPRMSDGILVSLAQQGKQKGPLRRFIGSDIGALSPPPMRRHFGLEEDQYLFGDCGAFSYVNDDQPAISVDQAVALYESYGFDLGASVDHIPIASVIRSGERVELTSSERQSRVDLTKENAKLFIESARQRKAQFVPVGTIQALSPEQFAKSVREYYDFGYRHLAIGGLVPRSDKMISECVQAVIREADKLPERPWIHLFGVFRPKLQQTFRQLKVDSFDSATYFRKAWLRSDQNYLSADGNWYAAVRVPMTSDGRTRVRMAQINADIPELERQEKVVLQLLSRYDRYEVGVDEVLDAVLEYDHNLARSSETASMRSKYRRTLVDRPWLKCRCNFCQDLGIHVVIFRGANRNKRRGAHNTLMLYSKVN